MNHTARRMSVLIALASVILPAGVVQANETRDIAARYKRAEIYTPWNLPKHIHNNDLQHRWIAGSDRLWYKRSFDGGHEFMVADPAAKSKRPAFDHQRMALALTRALGRTVRSDQLPIDALHYESARSAPAVVVAGKVWACDLDRLSCSGRTVPPPDPAASSAPGGRHAVFVKDHDLWSRDMASGQVRALSTDGDADRGYAILPESSTAEVTQRRSGKPMPPIGVHSPDGSKFLTYRLDQSKVKALQLLQNVPEDGSVRPIVHSYRYAFAGDTEATADYVIFDLATGRQIRIDHAPVPAVAEGPIGMHFASWSADGRKAYLIATDRNYRTFTLTEVDAQSGKTRLLRTETEATRVNYLLSHILPDPPLVKVMANGDFIWPSERSDFLHLYLYDGRTGALKNALTAGDWAVREIVRIDEAAGLVYFTAVGSEGVSNPYFRTLWRVRLDGTGLTRLTPEDADHLIAPAPDTTLPMPADPAAPGTEAAGFSPDGAYFVDSYSTPTQPTVTVVRDARGNRLLDLETAMLGSAIASYVVPEPFEVLAADGKTPIYGVLLKPSDFDPAKRYPVIDSIYPGPQVTRVPTRYMADRAQSIAELGFIVIIVDGRGTPIRSKAFRSFSYGNMGAAGGLADHVAAVRQLAGTRPWLDANNAGIYGTSGGGFATVHAMFDYPDFYKVGVASAGNHDQRIYLSIWGENYHGPFDDKDYAAIASYNNAKNFKGKLLIAHGDMDDNVHPANTMHVVDQLIRNDKMFDMLIMPNVNHGISVNPYFTKRLWDYFVVNMRNEQPPADFVLRRPEP